MTKDFVKLSRTWFDNQASVYDEKDEILYSKYGKISCRYIANYLASIEYERLLDIGCGTGYLIELLSQQRSAEYTGLDLSPKMVDEACKKNIAGATFVEGRSDALPFADESFDVVCCSQSFHHYPDTDTALQEARRVLKPGGLYVLSDTGTGPFKQAGVVLDNFIYRHFSHSGDCNVSYLEMMERDMERNGFAIVCGEKLTKFIYAVVGRK